MNLSFPERGTLLRYAAASGLVLAGFAARLALEPLFGASHTYTAFYSVVILAAYFLGAGPSILAAVLSAGVAYWCFAFPQLQWKDDLSTLTSMFFFAFTSAVSIFFITGLARALAALAEARARAERLAKSHAELFGELNERVSNHLQLVAALLQLQARDERDQSLSRALAEASARTLLISRVHRSVAGEADKTLDFDAFAQQLVEATLAAGGNPLVRVRIDPQGAQLPLDQATSVAVVLLECVNARLKLNTPAELRVRLRSDDMQTTLEVSEDSDEPLGGIELRRAPIEAMVEQLGGRFSHKADPGRAVSQLVFPRPAGALLAGAAAGSTLH
jgi:two-component sensor histidine kinase